MQDASFEKGASPSPRGDSIRVVSVRGDSEQPPYWPDYLLDRRVMGEMRAGDGIYSGQSVTGRRREPSPH